MHHKPTDADFEQIRPFRDTEVPGAIEEVLRNKSFEKLVQFIYPDTDKSQVYRMMRTCETIYDFQRNISRTAVKAVLKRSADKLTYSGFEHISQDVGHLFISNHRDIILDSAILNICLIDESISSTETAIGSNLLSSSLAYNLSRLNRNFIVQRNVPQKEMYQNSLTLSSYIHDTISRRKTSIWLAQREGRTKDGIDKTATGLLKMLTIGYEGAYADCFHSLNLLPMSVSYEYDPCDFLKTRELKQIKLHGSYQKEKNEDLQSMMTGALGYKGRIHLQVGSAFDEQIEFLRSERNKNEKIRMLAGIVDECIYKNYRLWPSNYIAWDILHDSRQWNDFYSSEDVARFKEYLNGQLLKIPNADETDRRIMLGIYSNSVDRCAKYQTNH